MKKIFVLFLLFSSLALSAATKDGISFTDQTSVAGKSLTLNGLGTRKATWFKVKVYVGALYLEKKTADFKSFLNDKTIKQIQMTFVRDVAAKKIRGGWSEALEKRKNYKEIKASVEKFNSYMPEVKEKMNFKVTFYPNKVTTEIDGKMMGDIIDAAFSKTLLSVWFIDPIDSGLKDGLLGL